MITCSFRIKLQPMIEIIHIMQKIGVPQARGAQKGVALTSSTAYAYNIAQFLQDVKTVFDGAFLEDVYNKLNYAFFEHLCPNGVHLFWLLQEYNLRDLYISFPRPPLLLPQHKELTKNEICNQI